MMNQKSTSPQGESNTNGRFLMRHSSASVLNIFGCCSPSNHDDQDYPPPEKTQPQKISIKNVMKKSEIYGYNGNSSISGSRMLQGGKRSQLGNNSPRFLNRKISQFSQVSNDTVQNRSERTIPKNNSQNVNFFYNKEANDNSVHNYHTTNYLVEKYIVQAEETNIFLRGQLEKKIKSPQGMNTKISSFGGMQKTEELNNNSPKWGQEINQFPSPRFSANKNDSTPLNTHFSFGQHQKNMFMNKFGGFRQVCSNRPSKQSVNIQNQEDIRSIEFADNESKAYNFAKNKNERLHNLVRNVQTLNEDFNDFSSSDKSEVIDSYQNIMSRIQDRNKMTYPFLTQSQQI